VATWVIFPKECALTLFDRRILLKNQLAGLMSGEQKASNRTPYTVSTNNQWWCNYWPYRPRNAGWPAGVKIMVCYFFNTAKTRNYDVTKTDAVSASFSGAPKCSKTRFWPGLTALPQTYLHWKGLLSRKEA